MREYMAKPPQQIYLTIRMPKVLRSSLEVIAAAEHRSLSGEVRRLIEQRVDQYEAQQKEAA